MSNQRFADLTTSRSSRACLNWRAWWSRERKFRLWTHLRRPCKGGETHPVLAAAPKRALLRVRRDRVPIHILFRCRGRLCRLLPLAERFHRHLPRGRGREGVAGGHVRRPCDGNSARDSQMRDGHRANPCLVEHAPVAATPQWPLLFDLIRSFQPRHARTHLFQCRDATAPACLRKRLPEARRGWITFGNVRGRHLRTARRAARPGGLRSVRNRRSS